MGTMHDGKVSGTSTRSSGSRTRHVVDPKVRSAGAAQPGRGLYTDMASAYNVTAAMQPPISGYPESESRSSHIL